MWFKGIKGITKEEAEKLISDAIYLLKTRKPEKVAYPYFQRLLWTDGDKATIVIGELIEMGVLKESYIDPDEEGLIICEVDYEKLKEFLKN